MLYRIALACLLLGAAGCPVGEGGGGNAGYCYQDRDCNSGQTCTRPQLCSAESVALTVRWLVDGKPPTLAEPGGCSELGDLRVEVSFGNVASALLYSPVPCAAGQFRVDKVPFEVFQHLTVRALSNVVGFAEARKQDLAPRSDDGGVIAGELAVTVTLR